MTAPALDVEPNPTLVRASLVLRMVALVLLVAGCLGTVALAGRGASSQRLIADLQQGRTQHVLVLHDRVVWQAGGLVPRSLELADFRTAGPSEQQRPYSPDDVRVFLDQYPSIPRDAVQSLPLVAEPSSWLWAASALAFLLIVFGPVPWGFNRWGWFWLSGSGRVAPLGLALFLVRSGPGPLRRTPPSEPTRSGGDGFLLSLLLSLLTGLLLVFLRDWLLPDLVDHGVEVRTRG